MKNCLLCGGETSEYFNYGAHIGRKEKLARCGKCRLIQTEPMPDMRELGKWYQNYDVLGEREPYYEGLAGSDPWKTPEGIDIARQFAFVKREFANSQIRGISNGKPAVLDIGSGPGLFLDLARRAGWNGIGVELNSRAAEASRLRFGIQVHVGTIETLSFAPESFDIVTLWDIFEHVPDPLGMLRRARSLLKKGGLLFIETPNTDSVLDFAVISAARIGIKFPARTFYGLHHLTLWNQKNITLALCGSGFRVCGVKQDFTPASRVFRGGSPGQRLIRFGVDAIQSIGKLTRRQNKMIITAI